jgi:hypothetical protein
MAAALIVAAGFSLVLAVYVVNLTDHNASERDFISYWSAGQLLAHHHNPYDFAGVRALETAAGRAPAARLLVMRNPPLAFFLVAPLGHFSPKAGLILWLFLLVGIVLLACFLVWDLHGRPSSRIHLVGIAFAPVIACMMAGQFGIFLLLGVVLFLVLAKRGAYASAGASLLFCALKPHLFLPLAAVLFLWALRTKKAWHVWAGFAAAATASCLAAYLLDPWGWSQYAQMARSGEALNDVVPTLGAQLRLVIDPRAVWLQFAPEAAACMWAAWYFWTRREVWDWMDHGLLVLLVGVLCAPYGFLTDEALLLPAILAGLYRSMAAHRAVWPLAVLDGLALAFLAFSVPIVSRGYLWTALAWLVWFAYATGRFSRSSVAELSQKQQITIA